ncbi:MAG: VOC family protein [Holophagae bacterium]|jgi:predicted enzyme related to lactoylglutathione lyase
MAEKDALQGTIGWIDLTVDDAAGVRDFYAQVAGWRSEPVGMGGYDDFKMIAPHGSDPVAGICHARGSNANLPAQWLIYITVDDLDQAMAAVEDLGGSIVRPPGKPSEVGRFCVIRDPAGAVAALYEPA